MKEPDNELISFAIYLTGHNEETILQMYSDWKQSPSKPIIEDTICTIPKCNRKVYKIGWCSRHYDMMLPRKFSK